MNRVAPIRDTGSMPILLTHPPLADVAPEPGPVSLLWLVVCLGLVVAAAVTVLVVVLIRRRR